MPKEKHVNLVQPNPFYLSVLQREIARGTLVKSDRILIACGGNLDRATLLAAGFSSVVISNLAPHKGHQDYSPYPVRASRHRKFELR
jgi:hypothetical protein